MISLDLSRSNLIYSNLSLNLDLDLESRSRLDTPPCAREKSEENALKVNKTLISLELFC